MPWNHVLWPNPDQVVPPAQMRGHEGMIHLVGRWRPPHKRNHGPHDGQIFASHSPLQYRFCQVRCAQYQLANLGQHVDKLVRMMLKPLRLHRSRQSREKCQREGEDLLYVTCCLHVHQ